MAEPVRRSRASSIARRTCSAAAAPGSGTSGSGVAVVLVADHHRRLALPRRLVVRRGRLRSSRRRAHLQLAGALDPGRLRLLPLHRQLRDPHGPDAADEPLADARVRAGRRRVGRQARRRPRAGGGEGGGAARRHDLAVGRGVRARRRQARARPALPRRAGNGQDDARQGARDRLQLAVRLDAGLRLRATFIGIDAIIVRLLARRAKKLARKWGGQCIVFIDEIDAVGMRRQALQRQSAGRRPVLVARRQRLLVLRPVGRAEPERRPDRRDAPLARAAVRAARARPRWTNPIVQPDRQPVPRRHVRRHGRRWASSRSTSCSS